MKVITGQSLLGGMNSFAQFLSIVRFQNRPDSHFSPFDKNYLDQKQFNLGIVFHLCMGLSLPLASFKLSVQFK